MPPSQATIGDWTETQLTRRIQDLFSTQPPSFLPTLRAENIQVTRLLTINDLIAITKEPRFRKVGQVGQPAFQNSWVNFGSNWQDAGFTRDPFGWVHLRGRIKSGTVGSAAFTLPPGYRISVSEDFAVISNGAVGRVEVLTDGTVIPTTPSNNTYVSLSGIRFRVT